MANKPILFNTEMVKAILEGRKTQTRRIIKPQPTYPRWNNIGWLGWDDGHGYQIVAPCSPGDILWVRETWCRIPVSPGGHMRFPGIYYYAADGDIRPEGWNTKPWKPSIHMPKEAARIFLKVKCVWPRRLQDITAEECLCEGIEPDAHHVGPEFALGMFNGLWDSTIKPADRDKYGWDANPWVWAIEFERCERPEGWDE